MRIISDDLIHFVGHWPNDERDRIRRAIMTFEQAWAPSDRASAADMPEWIVVQESPSWGVYYFAHRLGTRDSLTGRSATELADVLESSAQKL